METAILAPRTAAAATASEVRRLSWPGNAAMTGTSRRMLKRPISAGSWSVAPAGRNDAQEQGRPGDQTVPLNWTYDLRCAGQPMTTSDRSWPLLMQFGSHGGSQERTFSWPTH